MGQCFERKVASLPDRRVSPYRGRCWLQSANVSKQSAGRNYSGRNKFFIFLLKIWQPECGHLNTSDLSPQGKYFRLLYNVGMFRIYWRLLSKL